ncbi:hypothetical protein B0H67DRAFT_578329 [Lasiosphaeris hirsuta]|uniref:Secreted protein n=1 Tax=Lasiosphaeris hirsuta TaxID=260670 RepID=A0AA40AEQ0_9PEZI|nr:hypothetical protein B0H67DRAFT_578329 [Lasiosphaeris hirsuta]
MFAVWLLSSALSSLPYLFLKQSLLRTSSITNLTVSAPRVRKGSLATIHQIATSTSTRRSTRGGVVTRGAQERM